MRSVPLFFKMKSWKRALSDRNDLLSSFLNFLPTIQELFGIIKEFGLPAQRVEKIPVENTQLVEFDPQAIFRLLQIHLTN